MSGAEFEWLSERFFFPLDTKHRDAAGYVRITNLSDNAVFFILQEILSPDASDEISDILADV